MWGLGFRVWGLGNFSKTGLGPSKPETSALLKSFSLPFASLTEAQTAKVLGANMKNAKILRSVFDMFQRAFFGLLIAVLVQGLTVLPSLQGYLAAKHP